MAAILRVQIRNSNEKAPRCRAAKVTFGFAPTLDGRSPLRMSVSCRDPQREQFCKRELVRSLLRIVSRAEDLITHGRTFAKSKFFNAGLKPVVRRKTTMPTIGVYR
jgi:hypothetical protein